MAESVQRLVERLDERDVVLDVGAWGRPFRRADWVLDHMPYETRGLYGFDGDEPERFDAAHWIRRDICERTPLPFADGEIDFAICSQTLEDVRDPVWVCSELARVGKAGYLEVPSRLEEQSYGVQGPWVGWGHHHWLVDVTPGRIEFTFKHHILHGKPAAHFPAGFVQRLTPAERTTSLWWDGGFDYGERVFDSPAELDDYLESFVAAELARRPMSTATGPPEPLVRRLARRIAR